jgi:hypothetical protein
VRTALVAAVIAVTLATGTGTANDGTGLIDSARGLPAYTGAVVTVGNMPSVAGTPYTNLLAVADFNGDGLPDVFATETQWKSHNLYQPVVFVNDGHGGFADETSALFSGPVPLVEGPSRLFVADFNRDGRPDVLVTDIGPDLYLEGYHPTLVLSAPGGKLVDASANIPHGIDPDQLDAQHGSAVGDVNGDGAPDISLGDIGGPRDNGVLLNDGTGHFTREADSLSDVYHGGCSVILSNAIADLNGDGMNDVVVGGGSNPCQDVPTAVLFNDGHGRFPDVTQVLPRPPYGFDTPTDIQVGDLNGDGAPDIVLGYSKRSFAGLWLQIDMNDGHGHFVDETAQRLPPQSDNDIGELFQWIRLIDLNGDGSLDIAAGLLTSTDRTSPYFLNDGTGHFTALPDNLGLGPVGADTIANMGGYRGLDLVFVAGSTISIAKAVRPKNRLYVTVGPDDAFSFVDESGRPVHTLTAGRYTLVVWIRAASTAFRLRGAGVDITYDDPTTIGYTDVALSAKRTYRYSVTPADVTGSLRVTPRRRRSRDT